MTAHNDALIVEVYQGKRALAQLGVKVGRLEASSNELMTDVGEVYKGA